MAQLSEALDALKSGFSVQPVPPQPAPAEAAQAIAAVAAETPRVEAANKPTIEAAPPPGPARRKAAPEPKPAAEGGFFARVFYGNALAKIGAALLLLALGSLLKLTAEYLHASIQARLGGIALLAATALAFGWRQRAGRPWLAVALQGAGLAVLYGLGWYLAFGAGLVGASTAFGVMLAVTAAAAALAYVQKSFALSLGAIGAAFAAPLLALPAASAQTLVIYYAALDAIVLAASLARDVRSLNLVTFALTLGVVYARIGEPTPALAVFVVLYSLVPVLFAMTRGAALRHPADFTLVFGVPAIALAAVGAAVQFVGSDNALMAAVVFVAGAYYLALCGLLRMRARGDAVSLERAHAFIGLALVTVAVPLAFGAGLTAMVLAAEGAALAWYGLRRNHAEFRVAGLAVQGAAGLYLLWEAAGLQPRVPLLNELFAACVVIAAAAFATSHVLRRYGAEGSVWARLATPVAAVGGLWWFGGGAAEIVRWAPKGEAIAAVLAFLGVFALAMETMGSWKQWHRTRIAAAAFPFLVAIFAVAAVITQGHVLGGWMAWVFPPALAFAYWQVRRHEWWQLAVPLTAPHVTLAWLFFAVVTIECAFLARGTLHPQLWQTVVWGANLGLFALVISVLCIGRIWPARGQIREMVRYCGLPAIALGVLWVLGANALVAGGWGFPYVPVFNPLDLASTFILAVGTWMMAVARRLDPQLSPRVLQWMTWALALGKFWWANATVARTVHHYGGVPYTFSAMMQSVALQAILSVVWTFSALAVMIWGTRTGSRRTWFVGFGLLGVVGLKMLLVDLSSLGSASWTFSLLGIAVLVMAAGYFSPTPPKPEPA